MSQVIAQARQPPLQNCHLTNSSACISGAVSQKIVWWSLKYLVYIIHRESFKFTTCTHLFAVESNLFLLKIQFYLWQKQKWNSNELSHKNVCTGTKKKGRRMCVCVHVTKNNWLSEWKTLTKKDTHEKIKKNTHHGI